LFALIVALPAVLAIVLRKHRGVWVIVLQGLVSAGMWQLYSHALHFGSRLFVLTLVATASTMAIILAFRTRGKLNLFEARKYVTCAWGLRFFFWSVLTVPFIEELYFRGVLQTMVSSSFGAVSAIAATTTLFTLCHSRDKWLWSGLVGFVAASVYAMTESLVPGLIMHIIVNLSDMVHFYFSFYIEAKRTKAGSSVRQCPS